MGRLTAWMLANWERPAIAGFLIALTLLTVMVLMAALGPTEFRLSALVAAGGLLIIGQILFMWGSRRLVTPFKQAQEAFVSGDFDASRTILEEQRVSGKTDLHALTLLGNTYRQLGLLDESEAVLREALQLHMTHHFPLYGLGRTLLAQGRYAEASEAVEHALNVGAPPVVQLDLAEIRFRLGLNYEARALFQSARLLAKEPYRALMADYILHRLHAGQPPSQDLIQAGLAYWQASAERFSHTPYGAALAEDVRHLKELL